MAKFHRQGTSLKAPTKRRKTFGRGKKKAQAVKKVAEVPKTFTPKKTNQKSMPPETIQELETVRDHPIFDDKTPEVAEIERYIENTSKKISNWEEENRSEDQASNFTPGTFDGISNTSEKVELMEEQLLNEQRKAARLAHEMDLLKAEFEREKEKLEKNVKELKKELYRSAPLQDNRFFSLSRELKEAIGQIETISADLHQTLPTPAPVNTAPPVQPILKPSTVEAPPPVAAATKPPSQPELKIVKRPVEKTEPVQEAIQNPAEIDAEKPKTSIKKKKKKLAITGAAAVTIMVILSAGASSALLSNPKVDESLVQEYLGQDGQVQGSTNEDGSPAQSPKKDNQELLFSSVPFDQTIWETFSDPIFGVSTEYPVNASEMVKTDSNVTFRRLNGFIFKIQRVDTSLNLDDYWTQIKASNLEHEVDRKTFKGKDALHLTLTEKTDYPGDRYLIKNGEVIFDVWYAKASDKLTQDDVKRAEKMLESFRITESL